MTLSPEARLVPRPDVAAREINDGAVLVNMGSGACFELNRIGFEVWKALRPGATQDAICEARAGLDAVTHGLRAITLKDDVARHRFPRYLHERAEATQVPRGDRAPELAFDGQNPRAGIDDQVHLRSGVGPVSEHLP